MTLLRISTIAILLTLAPLLEGAEPPVKTVAAERLSVQEVETRLDDLSKKTDVDEETRKLIRQKYEQALEFLKSAREWEGKTAAYREMVDTAGKALSETKAALEALPTKAEPPVASGTVAELEKVLSAKEAALAEAKAAMTELEADAKRRAGRRADIPKQFEEAKKRLAEAETELRRLLDAKDETPLVRAQTVLQRAKKGTLEAEIAAYEVEPKAYQARAEVLPLRRELAAKRVALLGAEVEALSKTITKRRREETERQLEEARRQARLASPALAEQMKENEDLAKRREELTSKIDETKRLLEKENEQLSDLREQFQRTQEKVDAVGLTDAIGNLLRKQRDDFPSPRRRQEQVAKRQSLIREIRLELLDLENRRGELAEVGEEIEEQVRLVSPDQTKLDRDELEAAFRAALETEREYVDTLLVDMDAYFDELIQLDMVQRKLIEETEAYQSYVDERVLWVRSTEPIGTEDLRFVALAVRRVFRLDSWRDLGAWIAHAVRTHPLSTAAALILFGLILYTEGRVKRRIALLGEKAARSTCSRALPTLEALVLTILLAAVFPAVLWFAAWQLSLVEANRFAQAVSEGLWPTAIGFVILAFVYQTGRGGGLAVAHFGWSRSAVRSLRRYVRWGMVVLLPFGFIAATAGADAASSDMVAAVGRVCFTLASLAAALFLAAAWRPNGPLMDAIAISDPQGHLRTTRFFWYPILWIPPLVLALLAASGYYYTSRRLGVCTLSTGYLVLVLIFLRALLLRCILVKRRHLAMEDAKKRRAAKQAETKAEGEGSMASVLPVPAEPELDLAEINTQTRHFLEYAMVLSVGVGIWLIWNDILPALNVFERTEAWRSLDGTKVVTYADLALAIIIGITAWIAAKNIPGLLQMTWLQRLTADAGIRYTIAAVSRYLITFVGVVAVSHVIGISWAKIQWLVAAVGVGLGFGLQEIFANFVSGLILLFERPIRVGDIVTIGDVTGIVSQIRMRATTITNWDRKEYVVPNKEFVTGRLMNWTLSDSVNRIVIEVGVAYGSDTQSVTRLLQEIAKEDPVVLGDPEPFVTFEAFGDSALTFVLRCFLPDMDNWLKTVHALHMEIDRRFREAGIEIAFPQRDIHIRSAPERVTVEDAAERKEARPPADDSGNAS